MKKIIMELNNNRQFEIELYDEMAPNTVANFVKLVEEGYYDGKTFHRVIPGFVSQGGCPYGNGSGDLGYTIDCEVSNNSLKHEFGSLSMAHRGPNTGCCQFFICHEKQPHLDGVHTVFGKVVTNLEDIRKMKNGDIIEKVSLI